MDGAWARTAAMLAPYEGSTEDRGILMMDSEQLFEHARLAAENGFSMAVHAIGDRANHEVLDAYQQLRTYEHDHGFIGPAPPHRTRAGTPPQDVRRLSSWGYRAMQPIHATSDDMLMADRYWAAAPGVALRPTASWGLAWLSVQMRPSKRQTPSWGCMLR
jgi:predicted amidohydrolase YtcJ